MAGYDERKRVFPQRFAYRSCLRQHPESGSNFSVGHCPTRGNQARDVIDPGMESRNAGHVEADLGQVHDRAAQQPHDVANRLLYLLGGRRFNGRREALPHPRARCCCVPLRELDARQAAAAPCNAAGTNGGFEERKTGG